jgi:hypothetical protein
MPTSLLPYPPALEPLRPLVGRWVFHYPVFLNTYCLAHHLGKLIVAGGNHSCDDVADALHQQRHWGSAAASAEHAIQLSFTEKHEIELFIATRDMLESLTESNEIWYVPFTRYKLHSLLLHREKALTAANNPKCVPDKWRLKDLTEFLEKGAIEQVYVVTDIRPTANLVVEQISAKVHTKFVRFDIKDYSSRQEADFYDETPKLYVFSAPLLELMLQRKQKYFQIDVKDLGPAETFVGAKVRIGTPPKDIETVLGSVSRYYAELYALAPRANHQSVPDWWEGAAEQYSRAARSSMQPDPFGYFSRGKATMLAKDGRYFDILHRHHQTPGLTPVVKMEEAGGKPRVHRERRPR